MSRWGHSFKPYALKARSWELKVADNCRFSGFIRFKCVFLFKKTLVVRTDYS